MGMLTVRRLPGGNPAFRFFLIGLFCGGIVMPLHAQTPQTSPPPSGNSGAAPQPSPAPAPQDSNAGGNLQEMSTHESTATFKVPVSLVLVRVVVRDGAGHPVPNLKKDDFQLFDSRKPQIVTHFSVETPAPPIKPSAEIKPPAEVDRAGQPAAAVALPATSPSARPARNWTVRFLDVGIHPGGGQLWRLRQLLGGQGAAALTLFGEVLNGEEAARRGLVWGCHGSDELPGEATRGRPAAPASTTPTY